MTIFRDRSYLQKHRFIPRLISDHPDENLNIIIVIPCHYEFHLPDTLDSLERCTPALCNVEVLIVINAGEHHPPAIHEQNLLTLQNLTKWIAEKKRQLTYFPVIVDHLPQKHAGVGLARKIGMDEAVDRFEQADTINGIIVCLDADCKVERNYLVEIHRMFDQHPDTEACSIHFEHPLEGTQYSQKVYKGIAYYELFLRYYIQALRYAGFPYAYHTIGSSMAVTSKAYQLKGGMNRRKAGEDFYFLHKFIPDGHFTELTKTTVFPSPRPSDKVPFGTGKAIGKWLQGNNQLEVAYSLKSFIDLKVLLDQCSQFYSNTPTNLPDSVQHFLYDADFNNVLPDIRSHVASQQSFYKRFFQWLDALKVLKFIHFARDNYYPDEPLLDQAEKLAVLNSIGKSATQTKEWLEIYRKWQKNNGG